MIGRTMQLMVAATLTAFLCTGCAQCRVGSHGGCGAGCGSGCGYAGQTYGGCGSCGSGLELCPCTGPCASGGCEPGCAVDPGCGVIAEPGCGCVADCDPGCGIEPSCGVGGGCGGGCGSCGRTPSILGGACRLIQCVFGDVCPTGSCGGGCSGCDGELYWNEWHNDPPRCSDPCTSCGDWVGPAAGGCSSCEQGYSGASYSEGGYADGRRERAPSRSPQVAREATIDGPRFR